MALVGYYAPGITASGGGGSGSSSWLDQVLSTGESLYQKYLDNKEQKRQSEWANALLTQGYAPGVASGGSGGGYYAGSAPMSTSRPMLLSASLVCRVDSTRCPVNAALKACSAVSLSRISPTMITSGS